MQEEKILNDRTESEVTLETVVSMPDILKALGFEKEPDGMYYERGWKHNGLKIIFSKTPTVIEFWEHVDEVFRTRAVINYKDEIKKLLF